MRPSVLKIMRFGLKFAVVGFREAFDHPSVDVDIDGDDEHLKDKQRCDEHVDAHGDEHGDPEEEESDRRGDDRSVFREEREEGFQRPWDEDESLEIGERVDAHGVCRDPLKLHADHRHGIHEIEQEVDER